MRTEIYIISSVVLVSLFSLIGILFLVMKDRSLKKLLTFLVALSAGSLLGGAFLHIIPEMIEEGIFTINTPIFILGGIVLFFIIENFIHWHHCHHSPQNHPHHLGKMNLIGDGFHNFIDGLIIAGAYFVSIPVGIATTLAVIIHEIPQEISDFGVLLYSGFSKKRALFFNFISAIIALAGAILGIFLAGSYGVFVNLILPIAAGGFIYIAGSDLIPEIHKRPEHSLRNLVGILLGIAIMFFLTFIG